MRSLAVLIVSLLLACGGRASPHRAQLDAYPATRFIPPDATFAITAHTTDDVVRAMRDLVDGFGPLIGFDAAAIGGEIRAELGVDPLDGASLAELGIDLGRGAALWGHGGVSPVVALPLADPRRFDAFVERLKAQGVVLAQRAVDGVEVATVAADSDVALHWAVVDRWLLIHLEFTLEHEREAAWLRAALTAGGRFAGEADFADALASARTRLAVAAPPVLGVVRPARLLAGPIGVELDACRPLLAPIGRIFVAVASEERTARGAIAIEVGAAASGLAAAIAPAPTGWAAARGEAPLVVEWGLDLRPVRAALTECIGDDPLPSTPVWTIRAFAQALDLDEREARGAVAATGRRGLIDGLLSELPGRSFFTSQRSVGGLEVSTLRLPTLPAVSYAEDGDAVTATADLPIDGLLGREPSTEVARFELRPRAWSADALDTLLELAVGRARLRRAMVAGLRRWSHGLLTIRLDGTTLAIDAVGTR